MSIEINRIEKEFIFKNLLESQTVLEIHQRTNQVFCIISKINSDVLQLKLNDEKNIEKFEEDQKINVFFRFRGKPMTFNSKVIRLDDKAVYIQQPDEIFRDLSRGFERIREPEGISVSFYVKGQKVQLNYPRSELFDPVEEPGLANGFDPEKIAELLSSFRERAAGFATENKIIMFRERKPKTFEEKLIAKSGKILVLPFIFDEAGNRDQFIRERVLKKEDVVRLETEEGEELFNILGKLEQIEQEEAKKGIGNELYCPILYHQYVVGYIYLLKSGKEQNLFNRKTLDFVFQFSRILSYSLKVNGYFTAEPVTERFEGAELIDISGSGLLFSHPISDFDLLLYSDLDLTVTVEEKNINAKGRVMRKYQDSGRVYVGVRFTDMDVEDMEFLFDYLYGEEYRGDIDARGTRAPISQDDLDYFEE